MATHTQPRDGDGRARLLAGAVAGACLLAACGSTVASQRWDQGRGAQLVQVVRDPDNPAFVGGSALVAKTAYAVRDPSNPYWADSGKSDLVFDQPDVRGPR